MNGKQIQKLGKVYNHFNIPDKSVPVLNLLTCISLGSVNSDLLETVLYMLRACEPKTFYNSTK